MTRLQAINQMLAAISEAPVSTESSQHPDVLVATNLLDYLLEQLQAPGAWFNREYSLSLAVDTATSEIVLPSNTLQCDPTDVRLPYIQRGTKLYDPVMHSFIFTDAVVCDVILKLDFEEIPPSAQHYITADAAYQLHLDRIGDEQKLKRLDKQLIKMFRAYKSAELLALDINARSTPSAIHMLSRIQPYRRS